MLNKIVTIEQEKIRRNGFEPIVSTEEIVVDGACKCVSIGADTVIISSVFFGSDQLSNNDCVSISSASDCISGSSLRVSAMGVNIHKVMKQFINVKRTGNDLEPMVINIIKISANE